MGYMHISNLYKDTRILLEKECYALEKIHGTSAHIHWKRGELIFFSGGEKHANFVALFNQEKLKETFQKHFQNNVVYIYGEAYGGKCQGMSATYGKELKFIVFDVKKDDVWLTVPKAEQIAHLLECEFVAYKKISATIQDIDTERDCDSIQAVRNGMGPGKLREGIVLRPLVEQEDELGRRISKHKGDKFKERQHVPKVDGAAQLIILQEAKEIAEEWVTETRLAHVLQVLPHAISLEYTRDVIAGMIEDVYREAKGEIREHQEVKTAIAKKTVKLWKQFLYTIPKG
jgi:hypothetical protein